jgi:hypothetical protein
MNRCQGDAAFLISGAVPENVDILGDVTPERFADAHHARTVLHGTG